MEGMEASVVVVLTEREATAKREEEGVAVTDTVAWAVAATV